MEPSTIHETWKGQKVKNVVHVCGPGYKVRQNAIHPRRGDCHCDHRGKLEHLRREQACEVNLHAVTIMNVRG